MSKGKSKVVSIEIELKDYEPIKFSMDEARELYDQLHDLFGDKEQHNHYHGYRPWYTQPYWYSTAGGSITVSGNSLQSSDNLTFTNASQTDLDYNNLSVTSKATGMSVNYISGAA